MTNRPARGRLLKGLGAAGVALCALAGCGDTAPMTHAAPSSATPSASPSPAGTASSDLGVTGPEQVAPLTGVPEADAAARHRPALVLPVGGRAPHGLSHADLIYREVSDRDRYLAVFQSHRPGRVGPITQGRPTEPQLFGVLHALIGYASIRRGPATQLHKSSAVDVGYPDEPAAYRSSGGQLYASVRKLMRAAHAPAAPQLLSYADPGEPPTAAGTRRATKVTISIPGRHAATWAYDASDRRWSPRHGPHVSVANLIVRHVEYKATKIADHRTAPKAKVYGSGDCFIATSGRTAHGRWTRPGTKAVTNYLDSDGFPFQFSRGPTWVLLAPPGTRVHRT